MGCVACAKKKNSDGYIRPEALQSPPFNANDMQVYHNGEVSRVSSELWTGDRHKLLLFLGETDNELSSIENWADEFSKLDCDIYLATSEQVDTLLRLTKSVLDQSATLLKGISSYLLPTRLGIMNSGRAMRASVFVTKEAEVITLQHFPKVGSSMSDLHRMLYRHVYPDSPWADPSSNFVTEKETNDGAEKS